MYPPGLQQHAVKPVPIISSKSGMPFAGPKGFRLPMSTRQVLYLLPLSHWLFVPCIPYGLLGSVHDPKVVVVVLLVVVTTVVVVPFVVVVVVPVVGVVGPTTRVVVGKRSLHESISMDPTLVPATR